MADAEGQIRHLAAEVAQITEVGSKIIKLNQQIEQAKKTYKKEASEHLQNLADNLAPTREQLR